MQFLVLIVFLFFPARIIPSSATEIHEEKYFGNGENRVDSNTRILILSPSKTYLSFEVLQNLTGKGTILKIYNSQFVSNARSISPSLNFQFCPILNFVQFSIFKFVQFSILSNAQFCPILNYVQLSIVSKSQFFPTLNFVTFFSSFRRWREKV